MENGKVAISKGTYNVAGTNTKIPLEEIYLAGACADM
jgi:hypothetical protein